METKNGNQSKINPENKSIKITIILPTHAYFLSGIRDFTLNLIKNMTDFSEQWAYRFQSVVDELCNNAIEHGSDPGEEIIISFNTNPHESIEINVEDTGTAKIHLKASEINAIVEERRSTAYTNKGIRGRGLSKIVAEWSDELEFIDVPANGGIRVRVKKYLNDPKFKETLPSHDPTHLILN